MPDTGWSKTFLHIIFTELWLLPLVVYSSFLQQQYTTRGNSHTFFLFHHLDVCRGTQWNCLVVKILTSSYVVFFLLRTLLLFMIIKFILSMAYLAPGKIKVSDQTVLVFWNWANSFISHNGCHVYSSKVLKDHGMLSRKMASPARKLYSHEKMRKLSMIIPQNCYNPTS